MSNAGTVTPVRQLIGSDIRIIASKGTSSNKEVLES
jgi:hypothetical protein